MARLKRTFQDDVGYSPQGGPPDAKASLSATISAAYHATLEKRRQWPDGIPHNPNAAAEWWISMQEPPQPGWDDPRQAQVIGSRDELGAHRWECPYHLRLAHTFRNFLALSDRDREIVEAAKEDGVFWRGEEVSTKDGKPSIFIRVYDETLTMRKVGKEKYLAEVRESGLLKQLGTMLKHCNRG